MRDAEKALDLLIHDLRAPLSVAQGYLRLIKEQRLPSVEERDRALAKTMDALGRMSGLCSDAAAFLRAPAQTPMAAPLVPVAGTVDAMCRELQDPSETNRSTACLTDLANLRDRDGLVGGDVHTRSATSSA